MLPNRSSPRPGGGHSSSRSHTPRHDNLTGQERGLRRGSPVYRHASPSTSRHASPSPSRHTSKPHRQLHVHSRSRPMPDYKSSKACQPQYIISRKSEDSDSSVSSGSLFEKGSGYASSRTSLDDEEAPKRGRQSSEARTIRERRLDKRYDSDRRDGITTSAPPEDGNSVWSRVATAASTLTVSVSKAWAANIADSGEDTPPSEESRLFHAMKAYHLDKARDPTDLPPWLFSEHERRPVGQLRLASRHDNSDGGVQSPPSKSKGLRDVYDAAAAATSPTSPRNFADVPASKATSHLKALRDAKRNVLNPNLTSPREEKTIDRDDVRHRRAQRRMGMPVGPDKNYGRF